MGLRLHFNVNLCAAIALIVSGVALLGGIDQSTKDALRVKNLLKAIAEHPARSDTEDRRTEITEQELNAYITYRLHQEKNPPVRSLSVDLLANNHIQGKFRLDAGRLNLGRLFGDVMDFDFKGNVYTRNGAARLELTALQLQGRSVSPQLLDSLLATAGLFYGTEFGRIGDWYAMPKGIKRITVTNGRAFLYY
jgi:hypothetical protein